VVSFDSIVGVLSSVVECGRQELFSDSSQGVGPVGGDLSRPAVGADRSGEEGRRCLQVTLFGHEYVDDLPVLINGPVDVSPGAGNPDVGLVDELVTTHTMAARPGRVDEQRREPLDPSKQRHMVDLDTSLREQLLEIPVGKSVAQGSAHGDQNDLRRKPEPGER
jgi:hypothetical protein